MDNRFTRLRLLLVITLATTFAQAGDMPDDDASWIFSGGIAGLFDAEEKPVFSLEYRFAQHYAGIHPWIGASWATDGAIFAGAGALYELPVHGPWHVAAGIGPGYYDRKEGLELGSHLEIFSFAEVSYLLSGHRSVSLRLGHISNGGLEERNPGTEMLMLGYSQTLPERKKHP
jgi:lipid A 3-O-deacylase